MNLGRQHLFALQNLWTSFRFLSLQLLTEFRNLPTKNTASGILALSWPKTVAKMTSLLRDKNLDPIPTGINADYSTVPAFSTQLYLPSQTTIVESYHTNISVDLFVAGKYPVVVKNSPLQKLNVVWFTPLALKFQDNCYTTAISGKYLKDMDTNELYDSKCLEKCVKVQKENQLDFVCPRRACHVKVPSFTAFVDIHCDLVPVCPIPLSRNRIWIPTEIAGYLQCANGAYPKYVHYEPGTIVEIACHCQFRPTGCPALSHEFQCRPGK